MSNLTPENILDSVLACFCGLLEQTTGGAPGSCCLIAGTASIASQQCCEGFAWVRLVRSYLSPNFPAFASTPQACPQNVWALDVEIGITRCAPAACESVGYVCCEAHEDAQSKLMSDFQAMRTLFLCGCIGLDPKDFIVGPIVPYGPEGGCLGLKMTATIRSLP